MHSIYLSTIFDHTSAIRKKERSLSRVQESIRIEEEKEYIYICMYIRACDFCYLRVAKCKQRT